MIWHQAIGGDPEPDPPDGFRENPLTGGVVCGLLKRRLLSDAAIEQVTGEVPAVRRGW